MFSECTVGEIKTQYVQLAHEGKGDTTQYLAALKALDKQQQVGTDGKTRQYNFKAHLERKIIDKLADIIAVNPGHWTVEVIGLWIWVSGTEKPDAELLAYRKGKGLGLTWNGKRQCWQWKPYPGRARFSRKSKDEIGRQYGQMTMGARA